jgi:hypothetical protein
MDIALTAVVTVQTLLSILSVVRKGSAMSRDLIKIVAIIVGSRRQTAQPEETASCDRDKECETMSV